MTPTEFLLTYALGGLACACAGYILGAMKQETKSDEMRRWWFNRENRARKERK